MAAQKIAIDIEILDRLKAHKPRWHTLNGFTNDCLLQFLDTSFCSEEAVVTLGSVQGRDPSKAVNKKEKERARARARDCELQREEAHAPSAPKINTTTCHKVDEELSAFEPQIRAYWAAKPKTKTAAAWKLLMRELNKINDQYGAEVLEEQLLQAEANRWQSITLRNYEQFGVNTPHRPGQSPEPEFKHPAHEVFRAEDLYAKPEWQTPAEAPF